MYGASIGDTGIFEGKYRGVVRAVAMWSPWEHVVVFFRNNNSFSTSSSFDRARIVLTEKKLDFRINASYKKMKTLDFSLLFDRTEFISVEDDE